MRIIYTSKEMLKKFGVRVIYRKIRYMLQLLLEASIMKNEANEIV
jgi:uncharacterized protein YqgQ